MIISIKKWSIGIFTSKLKFLFPGKNVPSFLWCHYSPHSSCTQTTEVPQIILHQRRWTVCWAIAQQLFLSPECQICDPGKTSSWTVPRALKCKARTDIFLIWACLLLTLIIWLYITASLCLNVRCSSLVFYTLPISPLASRLITLIYSNWNKSTNGKGEEH